MKCKARLVVLDILTFLGRLRSTENIQAFCDFSFWVNRHFSYSYFHLSAKISNKVVQRNSLKFLQTILVYIIYLLVYTTNDLLRIIPHENLWHYLTVKQLFIYKLQHLWFYQSYQISNVWKGYESSWRKKEWNLSGQVEWKILPLISVYFFVFSHRVIILLLTSLWRHPVII